MKGEAGPYRYMAPEIYRRQDYTEKVDVYSFSMICYHLFEGHPMLPDLSPAEAARQVANGGTQPIWNNKVGRGMS